ncbi:hypothetical protein KAH55_01085, partial [bacterium]|nr:hypothetical protein [bacterium]
GAGKFIGTFLGLPDIGRITNPLTSEEIVEMDQYLFTLDDIQRKIGDDLAAVQKLQSPGRAVEKSIEKLHTLWLPISENPGDLTAIEEFKYQIRICDTQFTAFYRALEKTSIAPDRPDLVANTLQIGKMLVAVEQHLTSTVSYDILISRSFLASTLMIILAMIYTVASGLYGVVWTDVFQGGLIFGTIIVVCYIAFTKQLPDVFNVSVPMKDGTFMAVETTRKAWTTVQPAWKLNMDAGSTYSIYNLFVIAILFYLIKVTIEGAGGTGGYMLQRFFAAKSDREAGLLSLFWTFLLSFRWPFIVAIASLGIYYGIENGVIGDPERVLPVVVNEMIPVGLKGFLVAGLMAAAMSTFDSTVNAGAAYWTKDIYQAYLKKNASEKQLMWQSRIVSIVIVLLGLFFSLAIKNINEIWGWITMSIGAGMIVPQLIRWYWWRLNGYGFAIGIGVGMISAVLQKLLLPDVPEYVAFSITAGASFLFMIAGTFLTAPTDEAVLRKFYLTTRPFGFWGPIRKSVPTDLMAQINKENRRDILSTFMAVPWQVCLFLMWMALMMKRWDQFWVLLVIVAVLSLGLYLNWYRH